MTRMSVALQAKVGSLIAHVEEMLAPDGHLLDVAATRALIEDPEVVEWMNDLRERSLLPVRRGA